MGDSDDFSLFLSAYYKMEMTYCFSIGGTKEMKQQKTLNDLYGTFITKKMEIYGFCLSQEGQKRCVYERG